MAVTPVASDGDCAGHSGVVAVVAPIACNKQYNNGGGGDYVQEHINVFTQSRWGGTIASIGSCGQSTWNGACVWVWKPAVWLWNHREQYGGITGATSIMLATLYEYVWENTTQASTAGSVCTTETELECLSTLLYPFGSGTVGSWGELVSGLNSNFVGSSYDNTINWWVAQIGISNVPSVLSQAVGCLGGEVMGMGISGTPPSLTSIIDTLKGCA